MMNAFQPEQIMDAPAGEAPVSGFLHGARTGNGDALVLTHGAGGNCNSPLLVSLAESLSSAGIAVLRCDLPFRQLRPHGPPSPASAKRDQEGLSRAVRLMKQRFDGKVFLGGQSYGGRQASMMTASDSELVDGLLLLSYPLHPPGRPGQLRTAHFPDIKVPCLFVSGDRDPFGSPAELSSALNLISARKELIEIPGAGHSLLTKQNRNSLPALISQAFTRFFLSR